ncbi:hypothetical protein ACTA71_003339 [Dictyostelium dimigraforme]
MERNFNNFLVKIFCVGDDGVGKSCVMNSYSSGGPLTSLFQGSELTWTDYTISVTHNQKPLKLRLVIGDQNELRRIKQIEFNDIFLICFSVDSKASYDNIEKWNTEIRKILPTPNIILVGTKIDLRKEGGEIKQSIVTQEMGIEKAKEINAIKYMECSSATYEGVKEVFDETINIYMTKKLYAQEMRKKSFLIPKKNTNKKSCKTQ